MAISNKGGHGVTNMAGNHNMQSQAAPLNTSVSPGATGYNGIAGGSGGNFPGARKTGVNNKAPQGQTGVAWAPGTSQ